MAGKPRRTLRRLQELRQATSNLLQAISDASPKHDNSYARVDRVSRLWDEAYCKAFSLDLLLLMLQDGIAERAGLKPDSPSFPAPAHAPACESLAGETGAPAN